MDDERAGNQIAWQGAPASLSSAAAIRSSALAGEGSSSNGGITLVIAASFRGTSFADLEHFLK
jgi:hypothetical protein